VGRAPGSRLLASAALLLCLSASAHAQYFGRNKVQYDRDDVRVLATEHFDIYYSADDVAAAQIAGRLAERWHARLSNAFDHQLRGRQPLVLYGSHRRFEQTNVHGGLIDESTGGFTDSRKRRIVLPFATSLADTDHVLGHEIVHAFQFDMADRYRSPLTLPLWFIEGMAEYLTLGADDPQTAMWMRDAVRSSRLPDIGHLSSSRYFPYRWGAAVWSYLTARYGADLPARAMRARHDVKRRLQALTGASLDELTRTWHAALREKYGSSRAESSGPSPLIPSGAGSGRLNLAASLSPDGRRLIFLSERDQFSMDLFLADAATGRVTRKLITTAASAEFESLQYLHSAGAWDSSGSRFALATIRQGRPSILILDVDARAPTRELPLPDVDEVYSPTWSPDGATIAFSAMKGGVSDLFLIRLGDGGLHRLTRDAYADLQPSWSPDGRTIAFATDRFTTDLRTLAFGPYQIALLELDSRTIAAVPGFEAANHLDPSWAPDARSLYFVADPEGVSNVYRWQFSDQRLHQITDVETGVSGVTRSSAVLSVAGQTGALAFSVFRRSGYEVHKMEREDQLGGTALDVALPASSPVQRLAAPDSVEPVPLLPSIASRAAAEPYVPRLSLEGIGSPYLSGGGGPLGGYVAAGGSLLFGDLLGDHQLLTAVHVSSRLDESAIGAVYINRRSRWNWGLTADQTPEMRLRTRSVQLSADRDRAITRERDRLLWTNRHVGGVAAYPFNRAQRIEFTAGVRHVSFERERRTEIVSTLSGRIVEHETSPLPPEPSIGVVDAGIAFVGDRAIFGATGPMLGSRYRFQATTTTGGLTYTSVLADYRRYTMPVRPFTVAFRIVHTGRFGADAADFRLRDAYVGSSSLVRGYGPAAVVRSDCSGRSSDCPALNTLLANRLVAAKLELRIPVWSSLTRSSRVRYGMLPMDAFAFADAGAGWGGEQRFGAGGVDGRVVRSVGAGVRVNLMGLIFEAAAVRPLDLRNAGWSLGFNLRPAF
jgi:Tol biopolymer transport system component